MELQMISYLVIILYIVIISIFATYFNTISLQRNLILTCKVPELSEEKLEQMISEWNSSVSALPIIMHPVISGEDYIWKMYSNNLKNKLYDNLGFGGRVIDRENDVIKKLSLDEISLIENKQWKQEYLCQPIFTEEELKEIERNQTEEREGRKEVREYRNRKNQKKGKDNE